MLATITGIDDLVSRIPDGAKVALPPEYSYCAMELVRGLIRRGARDLHLVGVPQFGLQGDLLIGAGCVATVETAAVTLAEQGLAPRFTAAIKAGSIRMLDATCPAILSALQAGEKGIPFIPVRGVIGSDVEKRREDWIVQANPFAEDDPVLLVPVIRPDVAMFHAPKADRAGNVWVGVRRELMLMAHAAKASVVTVEEIVDGNLLEDAETAAGVIPGIYVDAIAEAREGAWPLGVADRYARDGEHVALYAEMARSEDGFNDYLSRYVLHKAAAE